MNTCIDQNYSSNAAPTNKSLPGVFSIYVVVPLAWIVINTLLQATKLFH